jgi:hypothetical protein
MGARLILHIEAIEAYVARHVYICVPTSGHLDLETKVLIQQVLADSIARLRLGLFV